MVLRTIGEDISSTNDLPWVNEYLTQGGEINSASFVRNIRTCENGLLVLATDFKGFLFKRSQIHKFLLEAIEVWVSNTTINYPLYAIACKGGKISLAVEDTEKPTVWIVEQKGILWEQKRKKDPDAGLVLPKSNPFLPTPPPTQNGRGKQKNVAPPDYNEMSH
jgi:hypothetical protein